MCHLSETTVATNDEVAYNETSIEATTADPGRIYYLKNSHGDVIGQMDEQGNLLASFAYNAFGELVSAVTFQPEQKEASNRFFYAGEQYDETSGLYYLRARQYDVSAGRFTQEDTYLGDGRNLYAYAHSNPLKYVDPTGHFAVTSREDNNYLDDLAEKRNDAGGGAVGVGEYLAGKAPVQVTPGTTSLTGQYVNNLGTVQPWEAHYDAYGRIVARTDYNAGNLAQGIPSTHYHLYEWGTGTVAHPYANHIEGVYKP